MKLKKGDVLFYNRDNKYSFYIEVYNMLNYGESPTTHVSIITDIKYDKILNTNIITIHEALAKGFVKSKYLELGLLRDIKKNKIKIKRPKKRLTNLLLNADKYLGRGYAWFDIFFLGLGLLFHFRFLKITGAKQLICSEAVARILYDSSNKKINIAKEFQTSYDLVDPYKLYKSKELNLI